MKSEQEIGGTSNGMTDLIGLVRSSGMGLNTHIPVGTRPVWAYPDGNRRGELSTFHTLEERPFHLEDIMLGDPNEIR